MKTIILKMDIMELVNDAYLIRIASGKRDAYILYEPEKKALYHLEKTDFSAWLMENEYQLRTMLHNKRIDTFVVGFHLTFVFRIGKDVAAYNDRSKLVVLDKREAIWKNYVIDQSEEKLDKLYTDASFMEKTGKGGFAVIHEDINGAYSLYQESATGLGNNLLELMAAIKGIEILRNVEKIRIVTDSQYVRKGLTEWIVNWELNDWMTVNGEKVKNIKIWQRFNELSKGKYIEFEWVKAHSNHFENTLCDLYARAASNRDK
jgi:ribonuclease HI